jgi:hypothetical protein
MNQQSTAMRCLSGAAVVVGLLVGLSACATTGDVEMRGNMRIVRASMVQACRPVGGIQGASGYYGRFEQTGLEAAEIEAIADARAKGANTIVWESLTAPPTGLTAVSGMAYVC